MAERDSDSATRNPVAAAAIAAGTNNAGGAACRERRPGSRDHAGHFADGRIVVLVESVKSGISGQVDVPDGRGRVAGHGRNVGFGFGHAAAFSIRIDE